MYIYIYIQCNLVLCFLFWVGLLFVQLSCWLCLSCFLHLVSVVCFCMYAFPHKLSEHGCRMSPVSMHGRRAARGQSRRCLLVLTYVVCVGPCATRLSEQRSGTFWVLLMEDILHHIKRGVLILGAWRPR